MSDFDYKDNGDELGVFTVGSNVSGANNASNTKANVDAGAAGNVGANKFAAFDGLTLVNFIVDATASNQNKTAGVTQLEVPRAGQECSVQQTRIARVIAGEAVAVNAAVYAGADGTAKIAAVTNMDGAIQGYALTAAAGAGEYISVLLSK
tara:strand:+ start:1146 stop:1595 length:450 start_codon:yes stop_codon:yes gene_type:complete